MESSRDVLIAHDKLFCFYEVQHSMQIYTAPVWNTEKTIIFSRLGLKFMRNWI